MNDEVTKQVLELVKNAKDFTMEQAPEVIKQYLSYSLYVDTICAVVSGLVFITVMIFVLVSAYKNDYDRGVILVFGGLASLIPFCICIGCICEVVEIHVAPKVYLLQSLHLIK